MTFKAIFQILFPFFMCILLFYFFFFLSFFLQIYRRCLYTFVEVLCNLLNNSVLLKVSVNSVFDKRQLLSNLIKENVQISRGKVFTKITRCEQFIYSLRAFSRLLFYEGVSERSVMICKCARNFCVYYCDT